MVFSFKRSHFCFDSLDWFKIDHFNRWLIKKITLLSWNSFEVPCLFLLSFIMWKSICIKSFLYKKFVGLFEQCNYVEKCLVFSIFNLASKTVLTKFFFHNFCSKRRSFVCIMSYIQSLCIGKLYSLHVWVNEQCNTLRDEWMSGSRPVIDQLLPVFHS